MKLQKVLLITFGLIAFVGVSACRKQSPPSDQPVAATAESLNREPAGGVVAAAQTKFFKGSIGSTLDLQMKLARDGDKLTGSYYYQRVGTKIDVRGEVDKDSNVTLEEFDTSGKQSGVFKGAWKQDAEGAIEISGSWSKPNSDKKTAFSLKELPIEFNSGAEFVSARSKRRTRN